jgi:hypothetical protein
MARRRRLTKPYAAAIRRMIEHGEKSDWFSRWQASINHAIAGYRRAVLERGRVSVDKYIKSIKSFKPNSLK